MADLEAEARRWLQLDRNAATREAVEAALKKGPDALAPLFATRMKFGTAGLRAAMGPGTSRMNDLTIIQTTQGLVRYVQQTAGKTDVTLAVGYDARHNSSKWASLIAAVCQAGGARCYLYDTIVPTPLVPFAVNALKADAGVMVTASHNPKQDNGYKVYWGNGVQIIPPHDSGIQKSILANTEPWGDAVWDASASHALPCADLKADYIKAVTRLSSRQWGKAEALAMYTAMHGVGLDTVLQAFAACGLPAPGVVASQAQPDPEFPTVPFPNPEERGALAEAMKAADAAGLPIILANDPDADRLALAEKCKETGKWRVFTGNELGSLLGVWAWERRPQAAEAGQCYVLASMVSSRFLEAVAKQEGFQFEVTLTGFKWMGNRADALRKEGKTVLFAFEEAIGYMHADTGVFDKDGVSAAVALAELAHSLYSKGSTLLEHLQNLYAKYGFFANNNSYFISRDPKATDKMFARLRGWTEGAKIEQGGYTYPKHLGDRTVVAVNDVPVGSGSYSITFTFDNDSSVTLRTSGTEPKIKFYSELKGASREAAQKDLDALVLLVIREWYQPEANGFTAAA